MIPPAADPATTPKKPPSQSLEVMWENLRRRDVKAFETGYKTRFRVYVTSIPQIAPYQDFHIDMQRAVVPKTAVQIAKGTKWRNFKRFTVRVYIPRNFKLPAGTLKSGKKSKWMWGAALLKILSRLLKAQYKFEKTKPPSRLKPKKKAPTRRRVITTAPISIAEKFGVELKPQLDMVDIAAPETAVTREWEAERRRAAAYPFKVDFPKSVSARLKKIAKLLSLAEVQREATSEHNTIMGESQYQRSVLRALKEAESCCPGDGERVVRVIMSNPNYPSRPVPHSHRVTLPSGETIFTETDYIVNDDDTDEMGFLPALLGAAVPLIAGALGGGDKKKKGAAPAGADLSALMSQIAGTDEIKNIVRELLATVPPPIKEQVRDVIRSVQAEGGNMKAAETALVKNIEKKFLPAVMKSINALKLAQTQREATSEHNSIAQTAKRWDKMMASQRSVSKNQKKIDNRLRSLQTTVDDVLINNKILPRRAVKLAGGNRGLDILSGRR